MTNKKMLYINGYNNIAKGIIWIINCTFNNFYSKQYNSVIEVELPHFSMTLIFFKCEFHNNSVIHGSVVAVTAYHSWTNVASHKNLMLTNVTFNKCSFKKTSGAFLDLSGSKQLTSVSFVGLDINWLGTPDTAIRISNMVAHIHGPISISDIHSDHGYLIEFQLCLIFITGPITISKIEVTIIIFLDSCTALFQGPITISNNYVIDSVILFKTSDVTFDKNIIFISNDCNNIIAIESEYPYIKVMQHANITFDSNEYSHGLIKFESNIKYNNPYPFCIFQYTIAKGNVLTVKPEDYTIIFDTYIDFQMLFQLPEYTLTFVHFASHCKWLPTSVFYGHNPGLINQQIIQMDQDHKQVNIHTFICFSNLTSNYDCSIDILGPVYPGQKLQVTLFTPCSDNTSVVFAETHNKLLPNTACRIAHQNELLYSINNYSRMITYTIVSDNTDMCELFLTATPHLYYVYEAFYIKLLSCPVGFTLQDGICNCDPLLPPDICMLH